MESMKFGTNYCTVWSKWRIFLFDLGTCLLYHKPLKLLIVWSSSHTLVHCWYRNTDSPGWTGMWMVLNRKYWQWAESWGKDRACLSCSDFALFGNFRRKFSCLEIFWVVSYLPIKYVFPPHGALCIWIDWGSLLSLSAQNCSSRCKAGSCYHISLIFFSNTEILFRKQS